MSINLEFLIFFLSENGPKFAYFQLPTHGDSGDTSFWLKRPNTERLEQANSCKKNCYLFTAAEYEVEPSEWSCHQVTNRTSFNRKAQFKRRVKL